MLPTEYSEWLVYFFFPFVFPRLGLRAACITFFAARRFAVLCERDVLLLIS